MLRSKKEGWGGESTNLGTFTGKSNMDWYYIHSGCSGRAYDKFGHNWEYYYGYVKNDGKGASGRFEGYR
ncbi:hypothetical protein AKJ18_22360 [Vibrio xuii]|nr:hypothetical protein AKJ18_22360 [Vibrio xuii]